MQKVDKLTHLMMAALGICVFVIRGIYLFNLCEDVGF